MEMLKDENILQLLETVHRILLPFFKFYCGVDLNAVDESSISSAGVTTMKREDFEMFCQDFGLVPAVVELHDAMEYFATLAQFYQANCASTSGNVAGVDEHLFVEALALCALGIGGGEDA